jgi:thiamine biosynthesis lipoprotein
MRIAFLILLLPGGAVRAEPLALSGATMGTTYHIKVANPPAAVRVGELRTAVEKVLAEIDRQMSTWRPDSEVSRFNRAPAGEWFAVSPATAEVVAAAQEISRRTDGALDVTVGPLVRLWHFGPDAKANSDAARPFVPPTDEAIGQAQKLIGYKKLEVRTSPPALRKAVAGLEIDLSSIASGYAIDQLATMLADRAATNWLVEIGGEVRAAGKRDDGKPWQVAIERPIPGKPQMQSVVPLVNGAIATAGDYLKFFEHGGRRYSHIIDPAAGRPVEHALGSVTVVADTCLAADGWDTPLMVLGPERGFACAEKNGITALFISRSGSGTVRATTAWKARFGNPNGGDGE